MFAPQHDSPPSLRQGDIIADIFFPLTRPTLLRYLGNYNAGSDVNITLEPLVETPPKSRRSYLQSVAHGIVAHGAVISQCCDLDRKHPKTSFSVCRLLRFESSRYKNPQSLIQNIDPWGPENPHFQFFYVGQVNGLVGEYLADLALLTSFGWTDYEVILDKKIHQLDDLNRNKFRVKVGAFFGRPMDEDVAAGLANPWQTEPPVVRPTLVRRILSKLRIT